jgi:hypothetical protein
MDKRQNKQSLKQKCIPTNLKIDGDPEDFLRKQEGYRQREKLIFQKIEIPINYKKIRLSDQIRK